MPDQKRRKVPVNGADMFVVSEQNPNDTCGGDCACGQHPTDQHGPFLVFRSNAFPRGGRIPKVVICASCAKSGVLQIEAGDEIAVVGTAGPRDNEFDGGDPDAPPDFQKLKGQYENEAVHVGLLEMPSFDEWLEEHGHAGRARNLVAAGTTGIDPSAKSILQAASDSRAVPLRGGPVHGRIDDPVAQLANPDNWGVPEGHTQQADGEDDS